MARKYGLNKSLHLKLAGFLGVFCVSLLTTKALAQQSQIVPDNTLGAESSRINRNILINGINADTIDNGAQRGSNLFHSFSEFNINDGQSVYFVNPTGVENILTRVTGGNQSNILGTLGVDGSANLFLINPAGIVFGENASLDIQGSFVGTTASGVQFGEQGTFSATNPQAPGLLTVNPAALFFNQVQANGGIINKSQAEAGINPNGDETTGLRVPNGQSLMLVGGNINLDGGGLRAYEGNIELASVAAPGRVGLDISGNTFSLNVPENVERGDISLANESAISVLGAGSGNLIINARNLEISDSFIVAGIAKNSENPNAQAGDVNLNATGSIELKDGSRIQNSVNSQGNSGDIFVQASNSVSLVYSDIFNNIEQGGVGKSGNINITAESFSLTDGSTIQTLLRSADVENNLPSGRGNAGNIDINVRDAVSIAGIKDGFSSTIFSQVGIGAIGNAGDININADSLSLAGGSEINAQTLGQGNAGDITVNARESISLDGSGDVTLIDGSNGTIFTRIINSVNPEAVGDAGDIQLNTGNLWVTNGAFISSSMNGKGDAGNININARDTVTFDNDSSIMSDIFPGAVGKGGDIRVTTGTLTLTNGGQLSTTVFGEGNAGNIFVEARDSVKLDGVLPNANASELNDNVLDGVTTVSGIYSSLAGGVGKGGDIKIATGSLFVTNFAAITASTSGEGNAGNITINARDKVIFSDLGNAESASLSTVGNGGDIRIRASELLLKNGGLLSTFSSGSGNAGNIFLDVPDTITFDGVTSNGFVSRAGSFAINGNAGNIEVKTGSLFLTNGGQMDTGIFGQENSDNITNAGNITINARDTVNIDGELSVLSTQLSSGKGKGGDIQIITNSLSVTNGAKLFAITSGEGNAGKVNINAGDSVTFDEGSVAFTLVDTNAIGNGGNIEITTDSLSITNGSQINASTLGRGNGGKINIDAGDAVSLSDSGRIVSSVNPGGIGKGGSINIDTQTLKLTSGSRIAANVLGAEGNLPGGKGKGGDININASESVTLSGIGSTGFVSGILSSTQTGAAGDAGNITVTTGNFDVSDRAIVTATTFNDGNAGNITFNANTFEAVKGGRITTSTASSGKAGTINLNIEDKITLSGSEQGLTTGLFASTSAESSGKGGSIFIDPRLVIIENGALVSVGSSGTGNAGNIFLQAGTLQLDNGFITAQTASTQGGNITLKLAELLSLRDNSQITTTAGTAQAGGDGGNIDIDSRFIVVIPEENSDITANAFSGAGGKVNVISSGIFGIESRLQQTDQSDITASSQLGISGETNINAADTSWIQNSFSELSPNIDTNAIIASSCIARGSKRQENSFTITGSGALPNNRAGNVFVSKYATGEVRNVETKTQPWKKGDAIIEPQGLYRLNNGQLLLSRECSI